MKAVKIRSLINSPILESWLFSMNVLQTILLEQYNEDFHFKTATDFLFAKATSIVQPVSFVRGAEAPAGLWACSACPLESKHSLAEEVGAIHVFAVGHCAGSIPLKCLVRLGVLIVLRFILAVSL